MVEGLPERLEASGRLLATTERPGRTEILVEADCPTAVVARDSYHRGWRAWVDGVPAAVHRADWRHLAVLVPKGRSRVVLAYHPPGWRAGLAVTALAVAVVIGLWSFDPGGRPMRKHSRDGTPGVDPAASAD